MCSSVADKAVLVSLHPVPLMLSADAQFGFFCAIPPFLFNLGRVLGSAFCEQTKCVTFLFGSLLSVGDLRKKISHIVLYE